MSESVEGSAIHSQTRERTSRARVICQRIVNAPDGLSHTRFDSILIEIEGMLARINCERRGYTEEEKRRNEEINTQLLEQFGTLGA